MAKYEYKINYDLSAKDIADLRESIGWNRMEQCYRDTFMTSYLHLSCHENETLIGYLDVVCNRVTDAYIQDLMVRPGYQSKGIGSTLMNMAITRLKEKHIYMISVVFEEKLLPFYKRFGFYQMMAGQIQAYRCD